MFPAALNVTPWAAQIVTVIVPLLLTTFATDTSDPMGNKRLENSIVTFCTTFGAAGHESDGLGEGPLAESEDVAPSDRVVLMRDSESTILDTVTECVADLNSDWEAKVSDVVLVTVPELVFDGVPEADSVGDRVIRVAVSDPESAVRVTETECEEEGCVRVASMDPDVVSERLSDDDGMFVETILRMPFAVCGISQMLCPSNVAPAKALDPGAYPVGHVLYMVMLPEAASIFTRPLAENGASQMLFPSYVPPWNAFEPRTSAVGHALYKVMFPVAVLIFTTAFAVRGMR